MKRIFLLVCLFLLSSSFELLQAQYQSISLMVGAVMSPGQKYSYTCLASRNSYTTPETIFSANLSFEIINPKYIPNTEIFSVMGNTITVSNYIDAKLEVKITCQVGNLTDSKFITVLPSNHALNSDNYVFLFIHGLAGSSNAWNDLTNHLDINDNRFIKSSNYKLISYYGNINVVKTSYEYGGSNKIPLITMDFSNNQNLSFFQQGSEVNEVIEEIMQDYGNRKLILFAHSMGGLAARSYIMNYGQDKIAGLVTVATPHSGSLLAYLSDIIPENLYNKYLKDKFFGLDINANAIQYLKPESPELNGLSQQQFPYEIPIVTTNSILTINQFNNKIENIINNKFTNATNQVNLSSCSIKTNKIPHVLDLSGSDGVVPFVSQLINSSIANSQTICPKVFITNKMHTNVPKDLEYMDYSINAIINSIKERENATSNNKGKVFIGFILDSSGSMSSSDPKGIRKSSVNQILNLFSGNEAIFIVDFDNGATWLNENHWQNWDLATLKGFVNTVDANGGTNLGAGLNAMKNALDGRLPKDAYGGVLMFTDGRGEYNNEAAWFQQHGIPVHTISYTDQADATTMSKIAQTTGGIYLQATNEQDVISALSDYFNNIVGYNKICAYNGQIKQGQSIQYTFYMDNYSVESVNNLSWNGSKISLKLIAPDGTVYEENQLGEWFVGKNYTSIKIKNPVGGQWEAIFTGVQIPNDGEPFRFEVSGDTPSKFKLKNQSQPGGRLMFSLIEENNAISVSTITPKIIVETPKHNLMDVSKNYSNGNFSFIPVEGEGNYNVNMSFITNDKQGNTIQREFRRSVLVGDDVPSFIAAVEDIMGNVITVPLGKWSGNQEGIKCYIYNPARTKADAKATGLVRFVRDNYCQISITEFFGGNNSIEIGDIVELDYLQWQNDKP